MANSVFEILLENRFTASRLTACLTEQFLLAGAVDSAVAKLDLLGRVANIPREYIDKIQEKVTNNEMFTENEAFLERVNILLGKHGADPILQKRASEGFPNFDVPFLDDIPF